MYNGVGVRTARGTGTSGHVQKNLAQAPKKKIDYRYVDEKPKVRKSKSRSGDLLEHQKKRKIEVELVLWAEDNGYTLEDGYGVFAILYDQLTKAIQENSRRNRRGTQQTEGCT